MNGDSSNGIAAIKNFQNSQLFNQQLITVSPSRQRSQVAIGVRSKN